MAAETIKASSTEIPKLVGNVWSFTESNRILKPSFYTKEFGKLEDLKEPAQKLVRGIYHLYVGEGWKNSRILVSSNGRSMSMVLTHPSKIEVTKKAPSRTDIVKEKIGARFRESINWWKLPDDGINTLLSGTNLRVLRAICAYNEVEGIEKTGWLVKEKKPVFYYQMGVGYIEIYFSSISKEIERITDEIASLRQQTESITSEKIGKLNELQGQIVNSPVDLF